MHFGICNALFQRQFFDGFAHYNMFNHHFFDDGGHEKYEDFISGADTLYVIVDPPYGGLVEALKHTLDSIQRDSNSSGNIVKYIHIIHFIYKLGHFCSAF